MITYILVMPFLYFFAYLPTDVLYKISDFVAFVLRVVVRYRKKVVLSNLRNSFPEKNEQEIQKLAKQFYTHLADRIVENIRCIVITREEIEKRVEIVNQKLLDDLYDKGKNIVFVNGHVASWEFGTYRLCQICKHKLYGLVSKVENDYFNNMVQRTRGKMGMHLIFMQDSKQFFKEQLTTLSAVAFISDQSPSNVKRAYWTKFLNQDTAFFTGGESYARLHNCAVVYAKLSQVKRGYYKGEFMTLEENPNEVPQNEITEKYVRMLEQHILENPSDWLWSHKKWKHTPLNPLKV